MFFCAEHGTTTPAPVLDRLVRNWLATNVGWPLSLDWNISDYRTYVDAVSAWGNELGVDPGDVEMLMFQLAAAADPASLWRQPELFAEPGPPSQEPVAEAAEEVQTILAALDEAGDLFNDLPGGAAPEDLVVCCSSFISVRRGIIGRAEPCADVAVG